MELTVVELTHQRACRAKTRFEAQRVTQGSAEYLITIAPENRLESAVREADSAITIEEQHATLTRLDQRPILFLADPGAQ